MSATCSTPTPACTEKAPRSRIPNACCAQQPFPLPSLAQARGTRTSSFYYDPAYASGTPITRETIAHAITALTEMDQTWQERDIP